MNTIPRFCLRLDAMDGMDGHASLHEVLNFPEFPQNDARIIPWMRGHCEEYGDF